MSVGEVIRYWLNVQLRVLCTLTYFVFTSFVFMCVSVSYCYPIFKVTVVCLKVTDCFNLDGCCFCFVYCYDFFNSYCFYLILQENFSDPSSRRQLVHLGSKIGMSPRRREDTHQKLCLELVYFISLFYPNPIFAIQVYLLCKINNL